MGFRFSYTPIIEKIHSVLMTPSSRQSKAAAINSYLETVAGQIRALASSITVELNLATNLIVSAYASGDPHKAYQSLDHVVRLRASAEELEALTAYLENAIIVIKDALEREIEKEKSYR